MANGFIGQVHIGSDDYLLGSTLFGICNTKDVNEYLFILVLIAHIFLFLYM